MAKGSGEEPLPAPIRRSVSPAKRNARTKAPSRNFRAARAASSGPRPSGKRLLARRWPLPVDPALESLAQLQKLGLYLPELPIMPLWLMATFSAARGWTLSWVAARAAGGPAVVAYGRPVGDMACLQASLEPRIACPRLGRALWPGVPRTARLAES
jgi:hypothetical protein